MESPQSPGHEQGPQGFPEGLSPDAVNILSRGPRQSSAEKEAALPLSRRKYGSQPTRLKGDLFPLIPVTADGRAPSAQSIIHEVLDEHRTSPQRLSDSGLHVNARPKLVGPYSKPPAESHTSYSQPTPESTPAISGIRGLIDMWNPEKTKQKQRFYAGLADAAFKGAGAEIPSYAHLVWNDQVMHGADERPFMPAQTHRQRRQTKKVRELSKELHALYTNPKGLDIVNEAAYGKNGLDWSRSFNPDSHGDHYVPTSYHKALLKQEAKLTKKMLKKTKPGWFNPRTNGVGVKTNRYS